MSYKQHKQYRLKTHDYAQAGYYFVTICVRNHQCLFGEVENEKVNLSQIGIVAQRFWRKIPKVFPNVTLDAFVVMPNHVHGIIAMYRKCRNVAVQRSYEGNHKRMSQISPKPQSLSTIIRSYKSICTKTINEMQNEIYFQWQPRFHDRIIRNEKELNTIREYIKNNPLKWDIEKNSIENFKL